MALIFEQEVSERMVKAVQKAGVSFVELGRAMGALSGISNSSYLLQKLAHRKKCALIAFAMSQTCSKEKKYILWNLFRNLKIK